MKPSLRLLCGVLLTAFALSGCAEQILDSASKDPAPSVTSGEESTANTIAKFSTSEGLAPQPSDVVLKNVNDELRAKGLDELPGVSRLMPIRIPFSAPCSAPIRETFKQSLREAAAAERAKRALSCDTNSDP